MLRGSSLCRRVTTDIAEALDGVDVVFVVGPAYATEPFGRDTRGHLRPGMTVVVCPVRASAVWPSTRRGVGPPDESVVVGETSTLPYAARASMHASVRIFHGRHGFSAAAARAATHLACSRYLRQV